MVKSVLMEARRYSDVIGILNDIMCDESNNNGFVPVRCYNDNGKSSFNVDGADIKSEAETLMSAIKNDTVETVKIEDVETLYRYIDSTLEDYMHNFVVSMTHGKVMSDARLDKIKCWMILDNLITCLGLDCPWYIPDGWKRTTPICVGDTVKVTGGAIVVNFGDPAFPISPGTICRVVNILPDVRRDTIPVYVVRPYDNMNAPAYSYYGEDLQKYYMK